MPPPKLYDFSTADVKLIPGVTRIFYDFRSDNGLLVPSFREDGEMYRSFAMQKYSKMKDRCNPNNKCYPVLRNENPVLQDGDEISLDKNP